MSFIRQTIRTQSPFGEFGDPPLPEDSKILYEEEYIPQEIEKSKSHNYIQEQTFIQTDTKRLLKIPSKKELTHADYIERLIVEASLNQQQRRRRRRRSSNLSSNHSHHIDKLLQNENNDWFFEKILEKFENIHSKRADKLTKSPSNNFDNDTIYGVERIVERRYYVKKPKLTSKCNQLTSTTDLTGYEKKYRQLSGVSTITGATTTCSGCSSSTPTYVENLRNQSDSLRNEISELKDEIEQLQTSQREFFQQLRTQFQSKTDFTAPTTSPNFVPSASSPFQPPSIKNDIYPNKTIPSTIQQQLRSISTAHSATTSETSSGTSTPTSASIKKPFVTTVSAPVAPVAPPFISEFMANKNPSIAPTPPGSAYVNSKPPAIAPINSYISSKASSTVSTPQSNTYINVKPPAIPQAPPGPPPNTLVNSKPPSIPSANAYINSKTSSIALSPSINGHLSSKPPSITASPSINGRLSSKPPSIAPTPPVTEFIASKNPSNASTSLVNAPIGLNNSRNLSVVPTPPVAPSPMSPTRVPIYENELAHRRVLSPHSQIVASSASVEDSSDASSRSITPDTIHSHHQKTSKISEPALRHNDLTDLVKYSSRLEVSGFAPSCTPIIHNPNNDIAFWDSVDQYIENHQSTNINDRLPPILQSNYGNRFELNNSTTKQLDKYNLEIRQQTFVESSAPLIMPPIDILS